MKFIHTADWHLGKLVHGVHMTEDQASILNQFIDLVQQEKPDAVIIAGDLYDRSVPPTDAVQLLDSTLTRIVKGLSVPVLAIAGNHDSPDRLSFGRQLLGTQGFYIEGNFELPIQPVRLMDEHGPVNFYLLPYAEPALVRERMGIPTIETHDEAMQAMIKHIVDTMNPSERNVLIAHCFVLGGEESESERPLSIGGSGCVTADYFEPFHYVALGHLHRPQKVKFEHVRYSGSLMKYSFSEVNQRKSISIINMDDTGKIQLQQRVLKPTRDMRKIEGYLHDLMDQMQNEATDKEDYLLVTLLDEGQIIDPMGKLQSVYPHVLKLERKIFARSDEAAAATATVQQDLTKVSKLDLFQEFHSFVTQTEFNEKKREIIKRVLQEIEKEERNG